MNQTHRIRRHASLSLHTHTFRFSWLRLAPPMVLEHQQMEMFSYSHQENNSKTRTRPHAGKSCRPIRGCPPPPHTHLFSQRHNFNKDIKEDCPACGDSRTHTNTHLCTPIFVGTSIGLIQQDGSMNQMKYIKAIPKAGTLG